MAYDDLVSRRYFRRDDSRKLLGYRRARGSKQFLNTSRLRRTDPNCFTFARLKITLSKANNYTTADYGCIGTRTWFRRSPRTRWFVRPIGVERLGNCLAAREYLDAV